MDFLIKNGFILGTSLAVQWLRLHASTAGGADVIPCQGELRSHMLPGAAQKTNKEKYFLILNIRNNN